MKRVSEFLADLDPHGIYDSAAIKKRFEAETGKPACWPEYSERETANAMSNRGLGGTLHPANGKKLCYGYSVAESLARKYAPGYKCTKMGRGSAFREAIE